MGGVKRVLSVLSQDSHHTAITKRPSLILSLMRHQRNTKGVVWWWWWWWWWEYRFDPIGSRVLLLLLLIVGLLSTSTAVLVLIISGPPRNLHWPHFSGAPAENAAAIKTICRTYGNRCSGMSSASGTSSFSATNTSSMSTTRQYSDPYRYYLAVVIVNRIYDGDRFGMTSYEMKQWVEYMLYAGVEHLYWYDTAHTEQESQEMAIKGYRDLGFLTYHRFHNLFPDALKYGYHFEQDQSYSHFLEHYKGEVRWVAHLDADEYPFSPQDTSRCFLQRVMREYDARDARRIYRALMPAVSQVLMQSIFFLGNPIPRSGDGAANWLIEKYQRRKNATEGAVRQKPIYRPDHVLLSASSADPHFVSMMRNGRTAVAHEKRLRVNHYWGSRGTGFGPDTPDLVAGLVWDNSVNPVVDRLKAFTGLGNHRCLMGPLV